MRDNDSTLDNLDMAFEREQFYVKDGIKRALNSVKYKLTPEGYCHNCFEDVDSNKLFCNDKCATQYDIAQRYKF